MKQGLSVLASQFPKVSFLAVGWLSPVTAFILEKVLNFAVQNTILGTSILLVNFETAQEEKAYEEAVKQTYEAIKNKKILSQAEQDNLEAAVVAATKRFVHMRRVRVG